MQPESGLRQWFSDEDPQLVAFDKMEAVFTRMDSSVLLVHARAGDLFTKDRLRTVREATDQAWRTPAAQRVASIANFPHSQAQGDDLIVADLIDPQASLEPGDITAIKKIALSDPLLARSLISEDGATAAIVITHTMPPEGQSELVAEIARHVRALRTDIIESGAGLDVYLTGTVINDVTLNERVERETATRFPLALLLIAAVILFVTRSPLTVASVLIITAATLVSTFGIAGYLGFKLHLGTLNAPIILLTLAVADALHVAVQAQVLQERGLAIRQALLESVRLNRLPIFLTSATTALGFASLQFSAAPPFRDMGAVTAIGVMIAMAMTFLIAPPLLRLAGRTKPTTPSAENAGSGANATEPQLGLGARLVLQRPGLVLIASLGLVASLSAAAFSNELNNHYTNFFGTKSEVYKTREFSEPRLPINNTIFLPLSAGAPGRVSDPAYLEKLSELRVWLGEQPEVSHVTSIDMILRKLNQNMNGDDPAFYRLPNSAEEAAQFLLLYELSLQLGQDLTTQIDIDKSTSLMVIRVRDISSNEIAALSERIQTWLGANWPQNASAQPTGIAVMFAYIDKRNIESMLVGTLVALTAISLMIFALLRSPILGAASFIGNIAPLFMAFGVWALVVGRIDFTSSVVAVVALGIVVDFSIHFLTKFRNAMIDQCASAQEAVAYAFANLSRAMGAIAIVLIVGFGVIGSTDFQINQAIGWLVALAAACALFVDFVLIPAFLTLIGRARPHFLAPARQNTHE